MGMCVRRAAPWLSICAAAALALVGAGPTSAAAAAASGSGSAGVAVQGGTSQTGVQLPQDEAPHQTPDEWWYFNGHVWGFDPAGHLHSYGFEYVTFKFLNSGQPPVYFGNFAVTDLTRGTFQYDVRPDSYPVPSTVNSFSLHTGEWTMSGGSGSDTLHADLPEYSLDLQTQTTEPAALHGNNGVIPFGPLGTSDYYSWTSLRATGTIIDHGVTVRVAGISWMDHQWGAFNLASGAGWDWHSIQLAGGRQYMLYFIRDKSGAIVQTLATQVVDGQATNLDPSTFSETATGSWTSPATGITYSSGWRVTVPGGYLTITPDLVNSELNLASTQGVVYWEGDTAVHGVINGQPVVGSGYTEINPPG
jgi:predicted secreted hydrolase